jgi:tetratricopeptide (TPR) repeat protein
MDSNWGMATVAYGAALDALEKTAPGEAASRARILEKLQGSKEALAREHLQTAEELMESGHDEDARALLELALDLVRDTALRADIENRLRGADRPASMAIQLDTVEYEPLLPVDKQETARGSDDETFMALCEVLPQDVRSAYLSYGPSFRAGYLALNQGDFECAADALFHAMEENPSPASFIPLELATALLNLQRLDEASQWLETFRKHHPDALPGYQVLCEVFWEMGACDRAEALLETCPEELKGSLAYVLIRGESLSRAGRHSEAAAFYQTFMSEYGHNEAVLRALAGSYEALEDLEKARELYIEVMNQCRSCQTGEDLLVRRRLADISFDLNERGLNVLELYLSLAQEDPTSRPFYFQRISEIFLAMGNREEARRFQAFARQAAEEKE